jgi:hypothetical protein
MRVTNIEAIDTNYPADEEALAVNLQKPKSAAAFVLLGILVLFGIYFAFGRESSMYVKIGITTFLILVGRLQIAEYNKKLPPVLIIDAAGVRIYNKEFYTWDAIREITHKVEPGKDGAGVLVFRLHEGNEVVFEMDKRFDRPLEAIAAYVNKYWVRAY